MAPIVTFVTVYDIRNEAEKSSIDLTNYNDDEINSKLYYLKQKLESQTGRLYGITEITGEKHFHLHGDMIKVKQPPLVQIIELSINDTIQDLEGLEIDSRLGIIYLDTYYPYNFKASIDYYAGEEINTPYYEMARQLCIDLFFLEIDKGDRREVSNFKDGDTSINYTDPMVDIERRIKELKRVQVRSC